jgi:hypothetical protein
MSMSIRTGSRPVLAHEQSFRLAAPPARRTPILVADYYQAAQWFFSPSM